MVKIGQARSIIFEIFWNSECEAQGKREEIDFGFNCYECLKPPKNRSLI